MDFLTTLYCFTFIMLAIVGAFMLFQPTELVNWLQKKNYQYEVTFSLYMLTPTEKFIFNSVLFLTLSMLAIASTVYLPNHILTIARRASYYFLGTGDSAKVRAAAADFAEAAYQAAVNTTAAAQEAVNQFAAENFGWS